MRVLGLETSCDETAAAVVGRTASGAPEILSSVVLSQIADHARYGGVVPEIAARSHLSHLDRIISQAIADARIRLTDVDAIAATAGPGLIGGLLVGMMTAKALSACLGKPFVAVNHLEGHALTARLTDDIDFPYLLLLVSGGHTQILEVRGLGQYRRVATTIDDAAGEAFDKTAKLLGLPFPGGPEVEKAAASGDASRFDFPVPMRGMKTLNFSFSGLKTAVRHVAQKAQPLTDADVADICAAFQETMARSIAEKSRQAIEWAETEGHGPGKRVFVAAGGVAANSRIRALVQETCSAMGWEFLAPPLKLCGDNAAMIAWAGLERAEAGFFSSMDFAARSRWPLDEAAATAIGSGKRGAKA
jgi:N6-L-threonylcarbamoyladenine synthase